MLLGRLESILNLTVEITDFQVQLHEAVKAKENIKRSQIVPKFQSPTFFGLLCHSKSQYILKCILKFEGD